MNRLIGRASVEAAQATRWAVCAGLHFAAAHLACGLTLTCRASKPCSRVITAHRMRAFLLAMATHAFCQPTRALSCTSQRLS